MRINNKLVKIQRYSSGEMKLEYKDFEEFFNQGQIDIFYNNEEISFFELLILLDFFNGFNLKINLTLSYLPYQRMNHFGKNKIPTLQNVANILNSFSLNKLTIAEPHCTLDLFSNSKKFSVVDVLYKNFIKENPDLKKTPVIFTDMGGVEKYSHLTQNYLYGQKTRNPISGLIENYFLVGDIISDTVIIIDDIISTGDTIMTLIKLLENQNIKNIYVLSGHLEKNKHNKRISLHPLVKKLISTNSLIKKSSNNKIKLISVWEILNDK